MLGWYKDLTICQVSFSFICLFLSQLLVFALASNSCLDPLFSSLLFCLFGFILGCHVGRGRTVGLVNDSL